MNVNKLNKNHRYFIQFMLHNGLVTVDEALKFYEEISPEQNSLTQLKTLIIEINRVINDHSFKISITTCEVTGQSVFVWVNTKNDELSRLQVGFSAIELEYFHAILQEIVTSDDHRLLYPRCINISSTLTENYSKENGEKVFDRWVNGGYFVKKDEYVYLGARTILEFTTYLRANTENCTCDLCAELVFVGALCSSCDKNFHSLCIDKYLQNQHTCPTCKNEWDRGDTSQNYDMEVNYEAGPSQRR